MMRTVSMVKWITKNFPYSIYVTNKDIINNNQSLLTDLQLLFAKDEVLVLSESEESVTLFFKDMDSRNRFEDRWAHIARKAYSDSTKRVS